MKVNRLSTLIVIGLALTTLAGTGCKKTPKYPTDIPAGRTGTTARTGTPTDVGTGRPVNIGDNPTGNAISDTDLKNTGAPLANIPLENYEKNPVILAEYSIHFAFDSAAVRENDLSKVESVANYLKSNPTTAVLIEGNCDKRGTEEYNRSLGERRALAAREKLLTLGISSERIATLSYGEDKPADPAETDAAYAKNRRDDFVLLTPPAH